VGLLKLRQQRAQQSSPWARKRRGYRPPIKVDTLRHHILERVRPATGICVPPALLPVERAQVIGEHHALNRKSRRQSDSNGYPFRPLVMGQTTASRISIVIGRAQNQGGAPSSLFATCLRSKLNQIASRDPGHRRGHYHASFPSVHPSRSHDGGSPVESPAPGPPAIARLRRPKHDVFASTARCTRPLATPICRATDWGIRTARLLPHFLIVAFMVFLQ